MTKRKSIGTWAIFAVAIVLASNPGNELHAQQAMKIGDILTGELSAMRQRVGGKRVQTFQLTSVPRRLPGKAGLCDLTTGPETFQLVDDGPEQTSELNAMIGKTISVRVAEVSCAAQAGQFSEAVVTKWRIVGSQPMATTQPLSLTR